MPGFSNVSGNESIMFADNVSFDGTQRGGKVETDGQLLIGSTASPHIKVGSITSPLGTIDINYSDPDITIDLSGGGQAIDQFKPDSGTDPVIPDGNGQVIMAGSGSITTVGGVNTLTTQLQGLTNHAVLVGAGSTTITKLAVGTNGQVLIASTANDPAFATITSTGGTIAFTLGANTLNMEVASGGFTWTDVITATQSIAVENGYVTDRGAGVVYTLPASATLGQEFIIVGKLGLATITPNANQQLLMGSASGTVGATGTAVATNLGDSVTFVCITAGASTVWRASSFVGNWTLN